MIGYVYSKKYHRTVTLADQYADLDEETKHRQRMARMFADQRAKEQEDAMYAHGVCPKCHCFLPSGLNYCPTCKED